MYVNFRISMGWNNRNIENAWHNVFEMEYTGELTYPDVQAAFEPFMAAYRALHLPVVEFLQYSVSTWAADSDPYNPSTFVTVPVNYRGTRIVANAQPLAENECYWIRKQPLSGFVGKAYLRGVLTETDVEVRSDGKFIITPTSVLAPGGSEWTAFRTAMQQYLDATSDAHIVMLNEDPFGGEPTRRYVVDLIASGVKDVNPNHKWYNRAGTSLAVG